MPLTAEDRAFLAGPRLGFLTVDPDGGWPTPVPVWFEPADQAVQLFTEAESRKARRLRAVPRASLVAANEFGEPEFWVAVEGPVRIDSEGAGDLAAELAGSYWDLSDPGLAAIADSWRSADLVRVVIEAERVRRYGG